MVGMIRFMHGAALCAVLALMPNAWAMGADGATVVPCPAGCRCIPNAKSFGYFPTRWREWPGEPRPDKVFPQAIGKEVIPTPPGAVVPPPPKEVIVPEPILTPSPTPAPDAPAPNAPDASLPAVPLEPDPSLPSTLPGLPVDPPGAVPPLEQGGANRTQLQPEKKPAGANKNGLKQTQALPAVNSTAPFGQARTDRPQRSMGSPAGYAQVSGTPDNTIIASSPPTRSPQLPPPMTPNNVATRADWQAETPPLPPAVQTSSVAMQPSPGRQVTYQDVPNSRPKLNVPSAHVDLPPDLPPGLNGYCPVELVENEKWVSGDTRWKATHQGRTYLLSGPEQHLRFVTNPSRYCPVLAGLDPVLAMDENRVLFGQTEYCVVYDGRLYMFSGEYSLARFRQNPKRYAGAIQ